MQVRSPGDILPNIIRDLATFTNINTAAVLYDDTFSKILIINMIYLAIIYLVLDKHFNKLFVNLPVRHVYKKLGKDNISTEALLDDLVGNGKITNFFLLARYNFLVWQLLEYDHLHLPCFSKSYPASSQQAGQKQISSCNICHKYLPVLTLTSLSPVRIK